MRATATSAFKEAVKSGMTQDQAKEVARKEAKAAYRAVLKQARAEQPSSQSSREAATAVVEPSTAPSHATAGGVPLVPDAAEPRVLVLAPTRELCMQISAVGESIIGHLDPPLRASVASGCVVGGIDFKRQRQALLGNRPRLLVATPGRLLSQCGVAPASAQARERAAQERGESTLSAAVAENLPGRGSLAARRRFAARLQAEGKLPATTSGDGESEAAPPSSAAIDLSRISMLILDEADRLLDLGFEEDLSATLALLASRHGPTQPRRTLLFSATFSPPIRALAGTLLGASALRVTVESGRSRSQLPRADEPASRGDADGDEEGGDAIIIDPKLAVSSSVTQRFEVYRGKGAKPAVRRRLLALLRDHLGAEDESDEDDDEGDEEEEEQVEDGSDEEERSAAAGVAAIDISDDGAAAAGDDHAGEEDDRPRVVVFALYKLEARQLERFLTAKGLPAVALHGDMSQKARSDALRAFRLGSARVLVATDVAARGLDVRHVAAVINTSVGQNIENYVHRCGRCGRAGATGIATTFVVDGDEPLVAPLVALLERTRQGVPSELRSLATSIGSDAARAKEHRGAEEDDESSERRRMQIANREKQLLMQQQKRAKERGASRR